MVRWPSLGFPHAFMSDGGRGCSHLESLLAHMCDGKCWLLAGTSGGAMGQNTHTELLHVVCPSLQHDCLRLLTWWLRLQRQVIQEENVTYPVLSAVFCGLISQYVWSRYKGRGPWPHLLVVMSENLWTHLKTMRQRKQLPVACLGQQSQWNKDCGIGATGIAEKQKGNQVLLSQAHKSNTN